MARSKKDYRLEIRELIGAFNVLLPVILLGLGLIWSDMRDIRDDVREIHHIRDDVREIRVDVREIRVDVKASLIAQQLYTNNNRKVGVSGHTEFLHSWE